MAEKLLTGILSCIYQKQLFFSKHAVYSATVQNNLGSPLAIRIQINSSWVQCPRRVPCYVLGQNTLLPAVLVNTQEAVALSQHD